MASKQARKLHESTSRGLCQLAFLLFAVAPLFLCLALCLAQYLPFYQSYLKSRWESHLGDLTGLMVHVSAVETHSPSRTILHGVVVKNPETGKSIVRTEIAQVDQYRGQCLVKLQRADIETRRVANAWEYVNKAFLQRMLQQSHAGRIFIDQVSFNCGHIKHAARELDLRVIPKASENATMLSMTLIPEVPAGLAGFAVQQEPSSVQDSDRISVILKRIHDPESPTTDTRIASGAYKLPGSLLREFVPAVQRLGPEAAFAGTVNFHQKDSGWRLEVKRRVTADGTLLESASCEGVDFAALSWQAPQELTGTGKIGIYEAVLSSDGLETVEGFGIVNEGRIATDVLLGAKSFLNTQLVPAVATNQLPDISFKVGYCKFHVTENAIQVQGYEPWGGVLLWDANDNALAQIPTEHANNALPLRHLIAVLEATHGRNLDPSQPMSRWTRQAMNWLPFRNVSHPKQQGLRLSKH